MTGHETEDGDVIVRWGQREWALSVVVALMSTGAIGTSAYNANTLSARDAAQNERLTTIEAKSEAWDNAASEISNIKPLLMRIDERTSNLQDDIKDIKERLP